MAKYASQIVSIAKGWLGYKESDGTHKEIIDTYNSHRPVARNYTVKYTDSWCATFVSACAIKAGMTNIIPLECSCEQMITLFKKIGAWREEDNRVPSPGDIIFYDWQDSGSGDNTGWSDHVGIVESCDGTTINVIEGNYNNAVGRRKIKVDGKYIRGYGVPNYTVEPVKETTSSTPTKNVTIDPAKSLDVKLSGTYKVTASALHLRAGAGITKKSLVLLPKDTVVKNYGYYTTVLGVKWLYIQATVAGVKYTGFASSKYLKK